MPGPDDALICLGVVTGAIGVRGEVRVKTFTGTPEAIAAYGPLLTAAGGRFKVNNLRTAKGGVALKLKGINDRSAAEALKGTELCVPRSALGEPEEEEFFHIDLIGLRAEDDTGEQIGSVIAVHDFGAGDLLEVRLGATGKTELVPFLKATVPTVDLEGGRIVVHLDEEEGEGEPE